MDQINSSGPKGHMKILALAVDVGYSGVHPCGSTPFYEPRRPQGHAGRHPNRPAAAEVLLRDRGLAGMPKQKGR
jgi:hypothetical protein